MFDALEEKVHTEPQIRKTIKSIIEMYGELTTTELKKLAEEFIEYDKDDLQMSKTRPGETLVEQRIRNIVAHQQEETKIYPEGFIVDKKSKPAKFIAITGLSHNQNAISKKEIEKRKEKAKTQKSKHIIYKKINWNLENERRTELGRKGEEFVLEYERDKVNEFDANSIHRVIHLSSAMGDGYGYDIESINNIGETIFIEVKTTTADVSAPFYMSKNEKLFFEENIDKNAYVYRVYNFDVDKCHGQVKIISAKELFDNYNFDPISFMVTHK